MAIKFKLLTHASYCCVRKTGETKFRAIVRKICRDGKIAHVLPWLSFVVFTDKSDGHLTLLHSEPKILVMTFVKTGLTAHEALHPEFMAMFDDDRISERICDLVAKEPLRVKPDGSFARPPLWSICGVGAVGGFQIGLNTYP